LTFHHKGDILISPQNSIARCYQPPYAPNLHTGVLPYHVQIIYRRR